jgi:sterol desaturase/sphingolipid hydroxylase (fatty acid hydroxylase superfamily)
MDRLDELIVGHAGAIASATAYGSIVVFALLELVAPRRRLGSAIGERWFVNIALALAAIVLHRAAGWALNVEGVAAAGLDGYGLLPALGLDGLVALVAGFVAIDLGEYVLHRLSHGVSWLWRCHRVHHMDADVDFTTSRRHHPFEVILSIPYFAALYALLGVPESAIVVQGAVAAVIVTFSHANVAVPRWLDRGLRLVVVTPDVHRVHHSTRQPETDSNFATIFIVWDRLFGTYVAEPALGHEAMTLGLDEFRAPEHRRIDRVLLNPVTGGP